MQGIGWELCVVPVIIQKKRSEVVNPALVEFLIVRLHCDTSLVSFSNLSCVPNVDLGFSCQHLSRLQPSRFTSRPIFPTKLKMNLAGMTDLRHLRQCLLPRHLPSYNPR